MADVTIQMAKNGPLLVRGAVNLVDAEGKALPASEGQSVALCRCGQSARKPFCDGSHKRTNFQG